MLQNRVIPTHMISVNDAARMIVRGSLIVAPEDMRDQYANFVSPVNMGSNYGDEGYVSIEVRNISDELVNEFKKLQFADEKKASQKEVEQQVADVLSVADNYIDKLKTYQKSTDDKSASIILLQLETITGNIRSRKVVLEYPKTKLSMGMYGSLGDDNWRTRRTKAESPEKKEQDLKPSTKP